MNIKPRAIVSTLLALVILALVVMLTKCVGRIPSSPSAGTPDPTTTGHSAVSATPANQLAIIAAPTNNTNNRPEQTFVVQVSKDIYERLGDIEAVSVFSYKNLAWLELTATGYQKLQASGEYYRLDTDAFIIKAFDYRFDPLLGEPALPPELVTVYAPGSPGLYLVQWRGSGQDEWVDTLEGMGIVTLSSRGSYAYLVRMTPEQADEVRKLAFVRWVGVDHAAYRVRPRLFESTNAIEKVSLQVYDDGQVNGSVDRVIEMIEGFGGEVISDYRSFTKRSSTTTLMVNLPTEALTATVQLNDIILIDFGPTNTIEDENTGVD